MGLALPLYGAFLGFVCAVICFAIGQVGFLGALALYAGIGVCSVLSAMVMIAIRGEDATCEGPATSGEMQSA